MVDDVNQGNAADSGQNQHGKSNNNNDRGIPEQFMPEFVMRSQLGHGSTQNAPGEKAFPCGTDP